jgi:hypothetical protein
VYNVDARNRNQFVARPLLGQGVAADIAARAGGDDLPGLVQLSYTRENID